MATASNELGRVKNGVNMSAYSPSCIKKQSSFTRASKGGIRTPVWFYQGPNGGHLIHHMRQRRGWRGIVLWHSHLDGAIKITFTLAHLLRYRYVYAVGSGYVGLL